MPAGPETVSRTAGTDLSAEGFSLAAANSPAGVVLNGGGRVIDLTGPDQGALITVGSGVTLTLTSISGNKATNGGGLWLRFAGDSWRDATFTLNNGEIIGNTATANGGGIYVNGGYPIITGGIIISGNTAGGNGGGLWSGKGLTMKDSSIEGNSAVSGGGVYIAAGALIKKDADDSDSGTIYGATTTTDGLTPEDDDLKNTATGGNGHAAWVAVGTRKRNATAGPLIDLDNTTEDGWE